MIMIQMGHIINNCRSYDRIHIDSCHTLGNHTLMCVHTDGNHADTATFTTKQKHTHMKKKKKKLLYCICIYLCKNLIAKSQRASRGSTRIQINNIPFFSGGMVSFCLWHCVLQTHVVVFYHQDAVLRIIYYITDTNNNSPWRNEM